MKNQRANAIEGQLRQDEEAGFTKITAIATKQMSFRYRQEWP